MRHKLIVVGTSMGGLQALEIVLGSLPSTFALPMVIVQHRSKRDSDRLRMVLQRHSNIKISEPQDKEPIAAGHAYLAPSDYHLLVEDEAFALSTEGPVCAARPSIDVLFESAAEAYGESVIGVVLTGSSTDGAYGASRIKERGGMVIVQDPATAESNVMPLAAIAVCAVDATVPLDQMASYLVQLTSI